MRRAQRGAEAVADESYDGSGRHGETVRWATTVAVGWMALAAPAVASGPSEGRIPDHFVGVSVEWTLIDRYMGATRGPAFVNLLRNLGSGLLRIGGSSRIRCRSTRRPPDT